MDLIENNLVFLDEGIHRKLAASEVLPGDLLIVKASVGEKVCRFPIRYSRGNITQHIIGIRSNDYADMDYVAVVLFSSIGRRQLARRSLGSIIQYLGVVDARSVLIPQIGSHAQRYIGDKVRQAERLRERARTLETSVSQVHAKYIAPPTGIDFSKNTRRLPSCDLTERMDAHFYPAAVEQYLRQSKGKTMTIESLSLLVTNGQTQPEADNGVLQATVTNLGRTFLDGTFRTVERPRGDARELNAHDLLICNAAHNKSYIGRDVTYCQRDGGVYPSTEVMVIRVDRAQIPASFVRHYLKTEIGFLQIQSTIRGITAHSYPGDVKLIKIPMPNVKGDERGIWFATDEMLLGAGRCADMAGILTTAATQLVELLIEGKVTETDLVAAQKGIEAGDRTADRAILQTLKRGEGADAPPLFSDLGALYALLDEKPEDGDSK